MKTCSKCKESKSLNSFSKRNDVPSGLSYVCKTCVNKRMKETPKTPEQKAKNAAYQKARRHLTREWERARPKEIKRAKDAKRRAAKLQRTPVWLTQEQLEEIKEVYWLARDIELTTGEAYQVDHIVPLQGDTISGLHVPWNLQILPSDINQSKGNTYGN